MSFIAVKANTGEVKWLNANFSLLHQSFSPSDDILVILPLRFVDSLMKKIDAKSKTTLRPGGGNMRPGSAPSTPTTMRRGTATSGAPPAAGAAAGSESLQVWVTKWNIKNQKVAGKGKCYITLKKNYMFFGNEKSVKGIVGLDLYDVEKVNNTQLDITPSGEGWSLAKGAARNHICLQFENSTVCDKWYDEVSKVTCKGTQQKQFGVPLWYFEARDEKLPQVFMDCVRYLYKYLNTPEIFRQGGDSDDVKFMRSEYNQGLVPSMEKITDPHSVAALLKGWLSELPQPLLTYAFFSEFMTAMKLSETQRIQSMSNSIAKIPPINQRVLWICTQLWKLVHDQNASNFMHAGNLSVIFAPKVIHPKNSINLTYQTQPIFNQITEILILQGDKIFNTGMHSVPPEWSYILDPNRAVLTSPVRVLKASTQQQQQQANLAPVTNNNAQSVSPRNSGAPPSLNGMPTAPSGISNIPAAPTGISNIPAAPSNVPAAPTGIQNPPSLIGIPPPNSSAVPPPLNIPPPGPSGSPPQVSPNVSTLPPPLNIPPPGPSGSPPQVSPNVSTLPPPLNIPPPGPSGSPPQVSPNVSTLPPPPAVGNLPPPPGAGNLPPPANIRSNIPPPIKNTPASAPLPRSSGTALKRNSVAIPQSTVAPPPASLEQPSAPLPSTGDRRSLRGLSPRSSTISSPSSNSITVLQNENEQLKQEIKRLKEELAEKKCSNCKVLCINIECR